MPEELMRFKMGDGKDYSVKAKFIPIFNYGIKYKIIEVSKKSKEYVIDVFNLDEFRKQKSKEKEDSKQPLAKI